MSKKVNLLKVRLFEKRQISEKSLQKNNNNNNNN